MPESPSPASAAAAPAAAAEGVGAVPAGGPLRLLVLQPTPFCNLD